MQVISQFEQFSGSFENEASLRMALMALIERMPNTSNIRHLHGSNELGKDIVFDVAGAFAQVETIACVNEGPDEITTVARIRGYPVCPFSAVPCGHHAPSCWASVQC